MAMTAQQWGVFNVVLRHLVEKIGVLPVQDAWAAYVAFAGTAGLYIPTDADFTVWAGLAPTDPVPPEYAAFVSGLGEFYVDYHNTHL